MLFHVTHRPASPAPISVEFHIHPGMSRNQIVRTQLSHRPSNSGNAKGHPTFTLGHPTFTPGAPHLHPLGTPPQAPVSPSTCGPSRMFQSQANRPLPRPHAPGPADEPWAHLLIPSCLHPHSPGPAPSSPPGSSAAACRHCLLWDHRCVLHFPQGCLLPKPQACAQPASASRPPAQLPSPCPPDPGLPLHTRLSAVPWVCPRPASRQVGHCPSCAPRRHPCLILIPQVARSWHPTLRFPVPLLLLNISIIFQVYQLT